MKKISYGLIASALILTTLQGCAGLLIVGAATATVTAMGDKRTVGQAVEDQSIELKIRRALSDDKTLSEHSRIVPISYNGVVLLLGQAPNQALKTRAIQAAKNTEKVGSVHDHIAVATPIKRQQRRRDALLTARTKTAIFHYQGLRGLNIKVVSENNVVYLMGIVSQTSAQKVVNAVREVEGIQRIIQVFEYTD